MPNSLRFTLTASDGSNILLIGAPASANKLILTLTNVYESSVIIQHVQPGSTTQNFTLSESAVLLYFNGLMSNDVVSGITLSESNGWVLRSFFDQQAGQYLALVAQNDIVLEPNDSLTITLDMPVISATTADGYFTARYLNVLAGATESASQQLFMTLRYPPRSSGGSAAAVLPLQAEFVGSNIIYNDGRATTLTLRLTNTDADPLQPPGSRNPQPQFKLSFVQFSGNSTQAYNPGVLLASADAGSVSAEITQSQSYNNTLLVDFDSGTTPQTWTIKEDTSSSQSNNQLNKTPFGCVLGTGASANVEITISNLKTKMPAGVTSAVIAYYNFSGYPDGQVVAEIEVRNPPVLQPEILSFTPVNSSINIIHTGSQEFFYSINNASKAEFYVNGILTSTLTQNFNGSNYYTYLTVNTTSVCMLVASNSDNVKVSQSIIVTVDTVPIGAIMMWSGSYLSLPHGWYVCDGGTYNNVLTPNLRDRFIYGANQFNENYSQSDSLGFSGGNSSHNHSYTVSGQVFHISGGGHSHYINFNGSTAVEKGDANSSANNYYHGENGSDSIEYTDGSNDGNHTHSITADSYTQNTTSESSLPPYYALYFIMKCI
jgi:Phage Tail Collar Domain